MLPLTRPVADARPGTSPADVLTSWMATAGTEDLQPRLLRFADGRLLPLPVARWAGGVTAADESMLEQARGAVLDVGCGPGRLTAALHARGVDVLGLELLPALPVLARRAGAPLLIGDVFGAVPGAGAWGTVLLADGNIGIGGDAVRLLRRVRALLADGGRIVCELDPDEIPAASGPVRLEGLGTTSSWFPWAVLGREALPATAAAAGLGVARTWEAEGRLFAVLGPT